MFRRYIKSPNSYNPLSNGCVLFLPFWHPDLQHTAFNSIDSFGHEVTASGVTWGAKGATIDGSDDYIVCDSASSLNNIFDGGGTLVGWINTTSDGEGNAGRIMSKRAGGWDFFTINDDLSDVKLKFFSERSIANGGWETAEVLPLGASSFVAVTYNADNTANNPIVYIGDTAYTVGGGLTETDTPDGTRTSDAAIDLVLGARASDKGFSFDGVFSEMWAYNRILSATELTYLRINSKGITL